MNVWIIIKVKVESNKMNMEQKQRTMPNIGLYNNKWTIKYKFLNKHTKNSYFPKYLVRFEFWILYIFI